MISVIMTGRNDNYGGNFIERLLYAFLRNKKESCAHGVEMEFIMVEWNPPDDNYLSYSLAPLGFQCYIVAPAIHDKLTSENAGLSLHPNFAKNVGIRRAKGEWIIATNSDVVFGPDVWDFIAAGAMKENALHRAERRDLDCKWMNSPFEEMEKHVVIVHEIKGSSMWSASGDFLFFSAKRRVGFNESINDTRIHLDSNFVESWGGDKKLIGRVYKADHQMTWVRRHKAKHAYPGKMRWRFRQPYQNPDNWGLAEYPERAVSQRITYIGED